MSVPVPMEVLIGTTGSPLLLLQKIMFKMLFATLSAEPGLGRAERIEATQAWFWKFHTGAVLGMHQYIWYHMVTHIVAQ